MRSCDLSFFLFFVWALVGSDCTAIAQSYQFSVPQMDLQVYVQPDASVRMAYSIQFENANGAHPIDVVDIGLPHADYQFENMEASVNGYPLPDIRKSSYINTGVEIHLNENSIGSGRKGTFEFECTMPDMVYRDSTDKNYASLQIIPTYFDSQSYQGRTKLQVVIHLLPGVPAEQIKYQNLQYAYTNLALVGKGEAKHSAAIWQYESWPLSSSNPKLSVSFPSIGMQRVVSSGPFQLFMKWFSQSLQVQMASICGLIIVLGFIFFRFSHGTGIALFVLLAGLLGLTAFVSPVFNLAAWPAMLSLSILNEYAIKRRRSAVSYLPAMATVEGGGIKRGLTSPQAAVLLEMPMGKILALVIYGLMRKSVVQSVKEDPLEVKVSSQYSVARDERLKVAGNDGILLHDYEHAFIDQLQAHQAAVKNLDLSEAMGGLVKSVAGRMAGFDLDETQAYYRAIIARAWTEAEAIGEVEQRDTVVDRNYEWILLDEDWMDVFDRWARRGYHYRPRWNRRSWDRRRSGPVIISGGSPLPDLGPSGGSWGGMTGGAAQESMPDGSRTSIGEVASSFAGWTENTMASLASAIEPAKMGLDIPAGGGIVDLSGVDRITADVFKALAENAAKGGSGGRGGGGGGCACACAGCACACACAGGGR